ncbi:hypothetical protein [Brachybacterium hainanense]|uniref:Histidine kinase n=1 Tax=Brachybacterium hainanense TaxID=1541174 RepID=A0ABV6RFU1_9MICO
MDLRDASRTVHEQLAASAAVGDEDIRRAAGLLSVAVEPAVRLALQDVVGDLAAQISSELAPGRVDLALRGTEIDIRVVPPPAAVPGTPPPPPSFPHGAGMPPGAVPPPPPAPEPEDDGSTTRVSFRPPQHLKGRLEEAASREGLSLNAYLVRALTAHLDGAAQQTRPASQDHRGRTSGWFI